MYTLRAGEMEDTQRRNRGYRKRGIIPTSNVRAAITIPNISLGGMLLLSCFWPSELSRLSNWGNTAWVVNAPAEGAKDWCSDGINLYIQ